MCLDDLNPTCGSQQGWQILAPRLRQGQKLCPQNGFYTSTPREVLFQQDKSWDAWSKLAKPVDWSCFPQRASFPDPSYRVKTAAVSRSIFECMPAELLKMVFNDEVLDKKDIVALGLCSQFFWQHMLRHVESVYRKFAAPWAGTEIACTGTYLTNLPESFEKDSLAIGSAVDKSDPEFTVLARRFNWAAWNEFQPPEKQQEAWRLALHVHRNTAAIPDSHWPKLEEDVLCGNLFPKIAPHLFPNPPPGSPSWVLRNLTTKEYVRMCAGSRHKGGYAVPNAPWLRLDDVLIMRICWTSSTRHLSDLKSDIDLSQGKWAGHRFEVVMVEDPSAEADGWTDITGEMVSEARELRRQIRSGRRGRARKVSAYFEMDEHVF